MILLVGPSACGKTEIALTLAKKYGIKKAITHTSREMRAGEKDGVDYYFVTDDEFEKLVKESTFVETTKYNNHYYGCSKTEIDDHKCVVIDPNGLRSFNALNDPHIISFFLNTKEERRIQRMQDRGDPMPLILERIRNDKITFAKENIDRVNFILSTDCNTVDQLAFVIYSLYTKTLEKINEKSFSI